MKTDFTLENFASQLKHNASLSEDYIADTRSLEMVLPERQEEEELLQPLLTYEGSDRLFAPTDTAHSQIASRLNIPLKYYRRMQKEAPELLSRNINEWFEQGDGKRMLRTFNQGEKESTLRAFLSDRYHRIDNWDLAEVVIPILAQEGVDIQSCSITETKMYIKGVFSKLEGEVSKGDVVQAGVAISNSEVGMGAVKIEPLIFRLVCLNGMIINDARFSARHVGAQVKAEDNIAGLLTDETLEADDRAIMLKVRDVTNSAFDEARFQDHLIKMQEATENMLEGNPVEAVKILAKKKNLTEDEEGSVLRHLISGGDLSQWGLLNAVTRASQDVESYDRATELETMGGEILTLNRTEWEVLQEAA